MAGCIEALEEVTEVLGCTDEGADNFDADATSGLEELCLYLENEVRFIAAMTDAMAADPSSYLLDPTSGVSGVQYSMSMDGVDAESGMSVSMELLSVIMVDLESQSMYNRSRVSYMGMLDVDTEIVMSGTDIMVTNSLGGPMASELGGSGSVSSISRDMTPNLEEAVRVASMGFSSIMGMEDMMMLGEMDSDEEDDHRDDADESDDEEPDWEDFEPYCYDRDGEMVVQTWDSDDSQQTMERECYEMGYEWVYSQEMEDDLDEDYDSVPTEGMLPEGASVVISHDPEAGLQSMFANSTDENGVMTMVIRLHEDGSFHSYDMTVDGHDADVSMSFAYLSFDVISIPEIDFSMDRTATPIFTEVETMMVCDDGGLVPEWSVMDGWEDCEDGSDEPYEESTDDDNSAIEANDLHWKSYLGGHCEWEGNPDDVDEDRWSCKGAEWDNWWYYCENHDGDWFCTDGYGQDPDHEFSADNDNYDAVGHDDDEENCISEDEDGVVHYDCDEDEDDWGYPVVMHAHVVNQVYNAPITDFELRVLDCSEDDPDDDSDPEWNDCMVMMTFPLNGGEIDNVTVEYLDNDGDGMVSSGDASVVSYPSDFAHGYEIQPYDTWAEEYSADSALIGPELPGFGAFLSLIGLLGAALIGRRQEA
jgi:PGF-CTERM protein